MSRASKSKDCHCVDEEQKDKQRDLFMSPVYSLYYKLVLMERRGNVSEGKMLSKLKDCQKAEETWKKKEKKKKNFTL